MTPHKSTRDGFAGESARSKMAGMRLFGVEEGIEDDDAAMSLTSPPRQSREGDESLPTTRLFGAEGSDSRKQPALPSTRKPLATRSRTLRGLASQSSADESVMSDLSVDGVGSTILRQIDLNASPLNADRRKRPAGASYPSGREEIMEESDEDMFQSPRPSPTYRTIDGRTVTSRNPFSPYTPNNTSMDDASSSDPPLQTAPSFPVTLDSRGSFDSGRSILSNTSMVAPNIAPRHPKVNLVQRDAPFDAFGNAGRYSFAGSPVEEIAIAVANTETHETFGMGSKARRVRMNDAASTSVIDKNALNIDTKQTADKNMRDEISPTDIMSFPAPPTPMKAPRPSQHSYTPVKKATVPPTPMMERRTLARRPDHNNGNVYMDTSSSTSSVPKSRFNSDFDILGELGVGSFGSVYKCLSRLDGCCYAVKVAKRKVKGHADKDRMLKEVYALAALSDQSETAAFHIVRYHQAWMEDHRLYIQTELCASTLQDEVSRCASSPHECALDEKRRYKLLREILLALEFLHRHGMVHLDIKPENIFVKNDQFKLGDFGLVSKTTNGGDVEEGDSRYMSMELLSGDHKDLTKSDIFSLGATMYEICRGRPLPTDGQEWQDIRAGALLPLHDSPYELELIIKQMMHPDSIQRPTAAELLKRRPLLSEEQKQLMDEKNKVLQAKMTLEWQTQQMKRLTPPPRGALTRASTWNGGF